jgi:hypothetical protein
MAIRHRDNEVHGVRVQLDQRAFLSVTHDESSGTLFHELDEDGHVKKHLDVTGDAGWIRVR